jgi:hypothetical protein
MRFPKRIAPFGCRLVPSPGKTYVNLGIIESDSLCVFFLAVNSDFKQTNQELDHQDRQY